jgi:hypothetical protein
MITLKTKTVKNYSISKELFLSPSVKKNKTILHHIVDGGRWVCHIGGELYPDFIDYCYDCNHHRCEKCRSV